MKKRGWCRTSVKSQRTGPFIEFPSEEKSSVFARVWQNSLHGSFVVPSGWTSPPAASSLFNNLSQVINGFSTSFLRIHHEFVLQPLYTHCHGDFIFSNSADPRELKSRF